MASSPLPAGSSWYVALGDSISMDEYAGGPGHGAASLLARNRDEDFPDWHGRDLASRGRGLESAVLAADGATSAHVLQHQLPHLERLDVRPSVVTVTVGGNDVLTCYGDTGAALAAVGRVAAAVETVLTAVRRLVAPQGVVVVGTVYDPSDGTGDAARVGLPPWPDVVEVLARLNADLCSVARAAGAQVAQIHDRFLGHGLARGDPAQGQARPADRGLWYCNVVEPNAWGASEVRAAFWEALSEPG